MMETQYIEEGCELDSSKIQEEFEYDDNECEVEE